MMSQAVNFFNPGSEHPCFICLKPRRYVEFTQEDSHGQVRIRPAFTLSSGMSVRLTKAIRKLVVYMHPYWL